MHIQHRHECSHGPLCFCAPRLQTLAALLCDVLSISVWLPPMSIRYTHAPSLLIRLIIYMCSAPAAELSRSQAPSLRDTIILVFSVVLFCIFFIFIYILISSLADFIIALNSLLPLSPSSAPPPPPPPSL